ncbi:ATP-binding cassette domain-containing protein [Diaminobutyricimonas sp. TR449]|uniref:ATP-binding cassette domain-containing protein n=1 Tax=Diaminobutyricimonas sp. TR449 TaxID=2708076 RepID=UPI001AB03F5D|nr:ATP-binding cassette domain-containing protein [Diaminobutyricimonas sp. TR449]
MTSAPMIQARGLTKQFTVKKNHVDAVTDLNLDVARGELVAFLGPNGAGKSTTLRMLTTLLPPTSGGATVAGFDILRQSAEVRRRIGYIGQGNSAGHYQRVRDELLSQGAFYGMSRAATAKRADALIESLDLTALAKRNVVALSGGQRRRLDIAMGLMHSPELLFLDEPSTGLDPQSRANLWQHIIDLRERRGTTIFVTTHYLEEADQFAERVMIMDHGRVIADDTASQLKTTLAGDVITLGFESATDAGAARRTVADVIRMISTDHQRADEPTHDGTVVDGTVVDGTVVEVTVRAGERALPAVLRELETSGTPASTAALRRPTLDDVFLALTGRSLREEAQAAEPAPVSEPQPDEARA